MSEVNEDGCFSTHMGAVQENNKSMQDNSTKNSHDSSQTRSHSPKSAQQQFWDFSYMQVPGPLEAARQLQELCNQWLMPDTNSKEQILEALVLKQFLTILPQAMKNWVQKHHPKDVQQAVTLVSCLETQPDTVSSKDLVTFEDIEMQLSEEEWGILSPSQKTLYRDVMLDIYKLTTSLGLTPKNVMGNDQPGSAATSTIEARPSQASRARKKASRKKHKDKRKVQAPPGTEIGVASVSQKQILRPVAHTESNIVHKPYKCRQCGKSFRIPSELAKHQRVHTKEKPFTCQQCGSTFRWSSDFKMHCLAHQEIKLHQCSWCQKCFSRNANLVKHQKIHTGEKPFNCIECGRLFIQKCHLIKHQLIHIADRPYTCNLCEKTFNRRWSLLRHQSIHSQQTQTEFPC
ncbi:zinc finger protein 75D [Rattus norvegicus]|uniref:zinc finger protein 75D n=1 Tax=Rattus norvegicus TaxID=10116 RepID=UPI0000DA4850|nr:zinc finger protein 75D [Rattus norvegicus]XP_038956200.1 zinc finger protein 75D isoform X1 [Rattus norvegicus]XP_038956201.1 zinc finger protein 75D isoform X1 [Rattus norvegicus]XP_038956202.1 zinc finger protein 75D isoform X1 [Rattus norvegicus]XP_038956203.1 zinc finger protein 75D isoform X1 [Rattus norvegicus]|eukprot:XP_008771542.1 PREDICTED: zinc finger protein 75D [Rattus norvegicus]